MTRFPKRNFFSIMVCLVYMEVYVRLVVWHVILIAYVALYPLLHQIIGRTKISIIDIPKYFGFVFLILTVEIAFFFFDLGYSEFRTFLLLIMFFFHLNTYRELTIVKLSSPLDVSSFNPEVIKKLNRSLHGVFSVDDDESTTFEIKNPYQMKFIVNALSANEYSYFQVSSIHSPLTLVIHLLAVFLSLSSLEPSSTPTTELLIGLLNTKIDIITSIILMIVASGFLFYEELRTISSLILELPLLYKKILTKTSLDASKKPIDAMADEPADMERARERAREILNARRSDVLYRKRDELKNKVDDIFGTEDNKIGLDPETLERVRLYNAVKRVLISTPPWSSASLKKIVELAGGSEEAVELVISNLIEKNEVPGIYDIWNQIYYGVPYNHWFTNEIYKQVKQNLSTIGHIRVLPDGSAEISINSEKK